MTSFSTSNAPAREWSCYPAYHGLLLRERSAGEGDVYLPAADDRPVPGNEPPLSFALTDEEMAALTQDHSAATLNAAVAATIYGPANQDKQSNEDFAIATVVDGDWAFAALADGVTQKTFWAARTARIACLVAFRTFRRFVQSSDGTTDQSLTNFRTELATALQQALAGERRHLLERAAVPPRFDEDLYRRVRGRDDLWFNSTLLVAALGEYCGFVLWAGDGGIVVKKTYRDGTPPEEKVALTSTDDVSLATHVGLSVTPNQFTLRRLDYQNLSHIEVFLASDGVDRTLQQHARTYPRLALSTGANARAALDTLALLEGAAPDNFSVARIARHVIGHSMPAARMPREAEPNTAPEPAPQLPVVAPVAPSAMPKTPELRTTATPEPPPARGPRVGSLAFALTVMAIVGFAAGAITASTVLARVQRLERQEVPPIGKRPRPAMAKPVPLPAPLTVDQPTADSFPMLTSGVPLLRFIDGVTAVALAKPGDYTVVVEGAPWVRDNAPSCEQATKVARARGEAVAGEIAARLRAAGGGATLLAAYEVRDPPAGAPRPPFRLVLRQGRTTDFDCQER